MTTVEELAMWEAGRVFERRRLAEADAEFSACWRNTPHRTHDEIVAGRLAQMSRDVIAERRRSGMPLDDWPGGTPAEAVSWCYNRDVQVYGPRTGRAPRQAGT